jgi:ribonuclease HII
MIAYHVEYPAYGFAAHKGYGTSDHLMQLRRFGACAIHRKSFQPVVGAGDGATGRSPAPRDVHAAQ